MTGTSRKMANYHAVYTNLPWQQKPWLDKSPVLLLTGSAGGGKSRLAGEKLHGYLHKYQGAMGLFARKTRSSTTNSTVLFMTHRVIGRDSKVKHWSSKNRFDYRNGSFLAYGGMQNEEQREQVRSIGADGSLDIVWLEEANRFTETDYQEILARMRGKAAPWTQVILSTNPGPPTHWIKRRLIDGGEAAVYYSSALDNPYNPPEYLETLDTLTGVMRRRLRDGLWVQAEGAVYEGFSDEIHTLDPFEIPPDWPRYRAIDFGYTNPFVCQWYATDPDGRLYLYRELYRVQVLVEDMARQIMALSKGENISYTVADHDAEDRATLQRHGIPTRAARKAISPGLQAVENRLRKTGDGRPRFFYVRGALVERDRRLEEAKLPSSTLEEFPAYVWPESAEGRAIKELPVDMHNHGLDALRYMTMELEGTHAPASGVAHVDRAVYKPKRKSVWDR